jgi:hypothetical protein
VPEFTPSITYPFSTPSIPVAIEISGLDSAGRSQQRADTYPNINNTYHFYEFIPFIKNYADLTDQVEGVFCQNQTDKATNIPQLPEDFSYFEQVVVDDLNMAFTSEACLFIFNFFAKKKSVLNLYFYLKIQYSYTKHIIKIDTTTYGSKKYRANTPVRLIHDFNSGIKKIL